MLVFYIEIMETKKYQKPSENTLPEDENVQQQVENSDTDYNVADSPYADFNTGNTEADEETKEE